MEIELERTFLVKKIPDGIEKFTSREILDIYIPHFVEHPILRLRKSGEKMELTKKQPVKGNDSSVQSEYTIDLSKEEYEALSQIKGKKVRKVRYYLKMDSYCCELDVFQDDLEGLVLADFEFEDESIKNSFSVPDFCLAEVTQEKFTAGGMICGKSYSDIENVLKRYGYQKIYL